MKRIGIIGLGLLGSAVAARLLQAKFQVKNCDTRPARLKLLQGQGLLAASSLSEVASHCDAVFTILPSPETVETTILGAKGGLSPGVLVEILKESAGASKMVDVRGPLMVNRRFDTQMKIDLFLKDFTLMLEEGLRLGVPLPLTSVAQQLATATASAGRGEEDLAAIVTTLERLAGLGADSSLKKNSD